MREIEQIKEIVDSWENSLLASEKKYIHYRSMTNFIFHYHNLPDIKIKEKVAFILIIMLMKSRIISLIIMAKQALSYYANTWMKYQISIKHIWASSLYWILGILSFFLYLGMGFYTFF